VIPLVRYLLADLQRSQRWVAPALAYLVLLVVLVPAGGDPFAVAALGATGLFPVGAWLTSVTVGCEDPVQEIITATSAGGLWRVRLAKTLAGGFVTVMLGLLTVVLATAKSGGPGFGVVALASMAVLVNAVGGAALGLVCSPPVLGHRGLAVMAMVLVCVAELIVPWAPPVRATLQTLNAPGDPTPSLLLTGLATAVAATVAVTIGLVRSTRRA
jgi:hypothetical protein